MATIQTVPSGAASPGRAIINANFAELEARIPQSAAAAVAGMATFRSLLSRGLPVPISALGDSLTIGNDTYSDTHQNCTSYAVQLSYRWKGQVKMVKQAGANGESAQQIAARSATDGVANGAKACLFCIGANNWINVPGATDAVTLDTVLSCGVAIIRACRAAGVVPVWVALPPNNYYPTQFYNQNQAASALCAAIGVEFLDTWTPLANSADKHWLAGYSTDYTHATELGAKAWADAIIAIFATAPAPSVDFLPLSNSDYLLGSAGLSNLVANPLMVRSTGSPLAAGLPDGWWDGRGGVNAGTFSLTAGTRGNIFRVTKGLDSDHPVVTYDLPGGLAQPDCSQPGKNCCLSAGTRQ